MMPFRTILPVAIAAAALTVGAPASAQQTSVDLSSLANDNSGSLILNGDLPKAGATVTIKGIGFTLSGAAGGNFVYPVATGSGSSFTYNVSIPNVTAVYTLANSYYGEMPNTIGTVTFGDTAGDTFSYSYTEGVNIRDYFDNVYNDSAPAVFGTQTYGPGGFQNQDNLDAQQIILPAAFAKSTLSSIVFSGTAATGNPNGEPALFAITAVSGSAVPEPATWAMILLGFFTVGAGLRYRRNDVAARLA